jgi:hypothetical protein
MKEGGNTAQEKIRWIFRLLATREPTQNESKLLSQLYEAQKTLFQNEPTQADKLIRIGESKPDTAIPSAELAAWTVVAQTVLNMDATIWKR